MAWKETKYGGHSIVTTETSSFTDETGKITTTSESWTASENQRKLTNREIRQERKTSLNEFLGVGRYFVIFCLILFFIAPVFNDLQNNYTWNIEKEGNTYSFSNPNENNIEAYESLGNKMLYGFTETLDTIGDISQTASNVTDTIGKVTGWFSPVFDAAKNMFTGVLDWFNGLFS